MGYKETTTTCTVQLIPYRTLSAATAALCERLRREAGRCWTDLVAAHVASRDGDWLTDADLRAMSKGGVYRLNAQSVQALGQKLLANVDTARALRQHQQATGQTVTAHYPYHPKPYQTVTWKDQAIRVRDGQIILSNGRQERNLVLPLPERFHTATMRKAELLCGPITISLRSPSRSHPIRRCTRAGKQRESILARSIRLRSVPNAGRRS